MYLLISVYNESIIRDRDGAEMLRPESFVAVCEHTSIQDIFSRYLHGPPGKCPCAKCPITDKSDQTLQVVYQSYVFRRYLKILN